MAELAFAAQRQQQIPNLVAGQMAALGQYGASLACDQRRGGCAHVGRGFNRAIEQAFGFGSVRRDLMRPREQMLPQRTSQTRFCELRTAVATMTGARSAGIGG